jgi:hypothetical protein
MVSQTMALGMKLSRPGARVVGHPSRVGYDMVVESFAAGAADLPTSPRPSTPG